MSNKCIKVLRATIAVACILNFSAQAEQLSTAPNDAEPILFGQQESADTVQELFSEMFIEGEAPKQGENSPNTPLEDETAAESESKKISPELLNKPQEQLAEVQAEDNLEKKAEAKKVVKTEKDKTKLPQSVQAGTAVEEAKPSPNIQAVSATEEVKPSPKDIERTKLIAAIESSQQANGLGEAGIHDLLKHAKNDFKLTLEEQLAIEQEEAKKAAERKLAQLEQENRSLRVKLSALKDPVPQDQQYNTNSEPSEIDFDETNGLMPSEQFSYIPPHADDPEYQALMLGISGTSNSEDYIEFLSANSKLEGTLNDSELNFYLYQGETYKEALSRWLYKAKYTKVGYLLGERETRVLSRTTPASEIHYSNVSNAIKHLIDRAIEQDARLLKTEKADKGFYAGVEVDDFLETAQEKAIAEQDSTPISIEARINRASNQAVITSSTMPTVMFNVKRGSLKDNYLRLVKQYGWKAKEAYYLGQDYRISFGYPIVTEAGNIKAALTSLLTPFEDLRAALVPTVRQVYILSEKD